MGCFVFNDTATTETSTYGHTLALHDALPISRHPPGRRRGAARRRARPRRGDRGPVAPVPPAHEGRPRAHDLARLRRARSEEHTSELQSLMRSSYAVFCLKKKITQSH